MSTDPGRAASVVLVDAVSTGALLAERAARRYRCVHVRSRPAMPAAFAAGHPSHLFVADIDYTSDRGLAVKRLAPHHPVAVIAGSELGVEAADDLAAALGLPGNDPARSAERRDKARMVEAVAAAGLPVARQLRTDDLRQLLHWHRRQAGGVVVKPLDSAGSDNVHLCHDDAEVEAAFHSIVGRVNLMLQRNESVLGQEYLAGQEYVVNSVSHGGRHWITDVWACTKTRSASGRVIYDREDLVDPHAPALPALPAILRYVRGVLDALAIEIGPAHTELVLTAGGPRLLETGARISGLANPDALDRCTGANQVDLTLTAYLDGHDALERYRRLYERRAHARCVSLIARHRAPLSRGAVREVLEGFEAFHSVRFRAPDGAMLGPTEDLNTSPGAVFLVHESAHEIDRAYRQLRRSEDEVS